MAEALRSGDLRALLEALYALLKHLFALGTGANEDELV